MEIKSSVTIGKKPTPEPLFPAHFKSRITGMVVVAFSPTLGIVLDPGKNSGHSLHDLVYHYKFGSNSFWERISGESTITISTVGDD